MTRSFKFVLGLSAVLLSTATMAQITLYEGEGFRGRAFTTDRPTDDFTRNGFNDRASSAIVDSGVWEACVDAGYRGRCVVLREGSYDSLARLGINDRLSSVRRVGNDRRDQEASPEPLAQPNYEYRRRPNERVYEANVISVHAVMGQSEQRCWVEREQVDRGRDDRNIGGGIIGGIIGGVLGHQIGGGRGKDLATVGGAVAGAAIGSNQGRGGSEESRDVRHCDAPVQGAPEYWEVSYQFRNVEHQIQMSAPPGERILVNGDGEPRQ